jgi:hypothetical protein
MWLFTKHGRRLVNLREARDGFQKDITLELDWDFLVNNDPENLGCYKLSLLRVHFS